MTCYSSIIRITAQPTPIPGVESVIGEHEDDDKDDYKCEDGDPDRNRILLVKILQGALHRVTPPDHVCVMQCDSLCL